MTAEREAGNEAARSHPKEDSRGVVEASSGARRKAARKDVAVPHIPPEGGLSAGRMWYAFNHVLCQLIAITVFDFRVKVLGRLPESGPVILAPNHQSFLDPWLVGVGMRRDTFYLARDTLFRFQPLAWFIASLNAIPVARGTKAPRQGIERSLAVLRAGRPLVLFPEGTRTEDGQLGELKRGIELVARQSGAPVVPIWVDGCLLYTSPSPRDPE